MKLLKVTYEHRAYSEEEAKNAILKFREDAEKERYTVQSAGYTYKTKKKGSKAWVVKCVAAYDEIWDEGEGSNG